MRAVRRAAAHDDGGLEALNQPLRGQRGSQDPPPALIWKAGEGAQLPLERSQQSKMAGYPWLLGRVVGRAPRTPETTRDGQVPIVQGAPFGHQMQHDPLGQRSRRALGCGEDVNLPPQANQVFRESSP